VRRFLLYVSCLTLPSVAHGQTSTGPGGQIHGHLDLTTEASPAEQPLADAGEGSDKPEKLRDLLIVPIPQTSPGLGTGVTLAAALFYNPNESAEPWISGIGAMYTSNGSWALGLVHKMSLAQDRFRAAAFAGYADVNVNFYGIGPNAGDRDVSIELNERGFATLLQGQMQVAPHFFIGPRFQYLDLNSSINVAEPLFPDAELPRPEFESHLVEAGVVANYDRRDSSLNSRRGELVTMAWMFSLKALGSDFDHDKFNLSANIYRPLGRNTVIAARASLCGVSSGGPFYDLCMYGSSSDLRGYEAGRYRDGG
jgi:hypothetical protein